MRKNIVLKIAGFLLCMATVAGVYTFVVIPSVRREEKEQYEKMLAAERYHYVTVLVYNGETPLLEQTVITEAVEQHFTQISVPADSAASDFVSDFEDIRGLQLKYAICQGQQVSFRNFEAFLKAPLGNERLKEFQICSLVAGQAMPGRYADILLRYPDGSAAVVVPKIQIYDIQYDQNAAGAAKEKNASYTVVFAVTEKEHADLTDACREGTLDLRIYLSDTQPASAQNYIPALPASGV